MFAPAQVVKAEIFSRMPDKLRKVGVATAWSKARGGEPMHSFLEGPAFDREGNLYCVDLDHSRIFKISPKGEWDVFADYDGGPNGLKIHKDGRIFVADRDHGVIAFDPKTAKYEVIVDRARSKRFAGLNDLVFTDEGELMFTDPGSSGMIDLSGKVYCLRKNGHVELLMDKLPYPNGLVPSLNGKALFVAVTRTQQILKLNTFADGNGDRHYKYGVFIQLYGGYAGPDGMAIDEAGNLAIAHAGLGTAWLFSVHGEPMLRIVSPEGAGMGTTNVAYGGPDRKWLYITESQEGVILRAPMPVAGHKMYSHQ